MGIVPSASDRVRTRIPKRVREVRGSRTDVDVSALPRRLVSVRLRQERLECDAAGGDPLVTFVDAVAPAVRGRAVPHDDRADATRRGLEMMWRATPKLDERRHLSLLPMQRSCDDEYLITPVTT